MLQRVNPLVPILVKYSEPTDSPVGALKKKKNLIDETAAQ
jgi:hypothetical protein